MCVCVSPIFFPKKMESDGTYLSTFFPYKHIVSSSVHPTDFACHSSFKYFPSVYRVPGTVLAVV